jgi:ABC-2 type transport system permease protein
VNPPVILATARRVLTQLRRDPRTLALIVIVPCILIALFKYVLDGLPGTFQRVGLPLVGIFPLISMFLVTSITMLRERTSGTLERLMTMPLAKIDILLGYALAFAAVAIAQAAVVCTVAIAALGLHIAGSVLVVAGLAVLNALLGMSLGLFVSAFATTEFQAVQFMPAFVFPQLILCGLFAPRATMARPLELLSDVLPMTYAYDGLDRVATSAAVSGRLLADAAVIVGCSLLALALGAATLRRRTP